VRSILVAVVIVVATAAAARADVLDPDALARVLAASPRACEGESVCGERERAIYGDAFARGEPVIEILTMGEGELVWERHGHIALCVRRPDPVEDICFNYGIGDFRDPGGMIWGFLRGERVFWSATQDVEELVRLYAGHDRSIYAQPLPLTAAETEAIIAKAYFDTRVENRAYAYDHFADNCTTRVRDVIDDATGHALSTLPGRSDGRTYRELGRVGFHGDRLALVVTDLVAGRSVDEPASYWDRMFLPRYLREAITERWGVTPIVLYQRQGPPTPAEAPSGRVIFLLVILLLTAPAAITRWRGSRERLGLAVAVVPAVVVGIALWALAIASPLPYFRWNEACLVFLPVDLCVLVLREPWRRRYARGRVAMLGLVAALLVVGVLKQPLWPALVWPLVPAAVVGFWPARWRRAPATAPGGEAPEPAPSSA
jgi:hypothetical protein